MFLIYNKVINIDSSFKYIILSKSEIQISIKKYTVEPRLSVTRLSVLTFPKI